MSIATTPPAAPDLITLCSLLLQAKPQRVEYEHLANPDLALEEAIGNWYSAIEILCVKFRYRRDANLWTREEQNFYHQLVEELTAPPSDN